MTQSPRIFVDAQEASQDRLDSDHTPPDSFVVRAPVRHRPKQLRRPAEPVHSARHGTAAVMEDMPRPRRAFRAWRRDVQFVLSLLVALLLVNGLLVVLLGTHRQPGHVRLVVFEKVSAPTASGDGAKQEVDTFMLPASPPATSPSALP